MAKILIIDDEHLTCKMLATFASIIGHESAEVFNSKEAWERLAVELPDVFLLDVMLPDVSGLELCRQLRANPPTANIPIIMISAYAPPLSHEASEAGANVYLSKPISIQSLKKALIGVGITA